MYSANIPPPPPPTYAAATATGLGEQYNTQYSSPLHPPASTQPVQPQPFGQPQPYGQPANNQPYVGPGVPQQQVLGYPQAHGQQATGGLPRVRFLQMQRLACMSIVGCFPLGIFAWLEFKKAQAAFDRGSQEDGERHLASLKRYAYVSLAFGFFIMAVIIINPFRFFGWSEEEDMGRDDNWHDE